MNVVATDGGKNSRGKNSPSSLLLLLQYNQPEGKI
uniref:Uncharacterized protein n=1 Tax=Nelumbo nucifera TaxID=4432 RepID=A0A822XQE5_NELNU|nr:TPA_asm: hypothetical protein HUJ06_021161 [Nelumbo nucifera]